MQFKLTVNPLALSATNHLVGKLLENPVIQVSIGVGKLAELDVDTAKDEIETLFLDGVNDAGHFPEAIA